MVEVVYAFPIDMQVGTIKYVLHYDICRSQSVVSGPHQYYYY